MKTTSGPVVARAGAGFGKGGVAAAWRNAVRAQILRWPLFLPMAMALGAAAYMAAPAEPGWPLLLGAAGIPLAVWIILHSRASASAFLCLLLGCAGIGALAGKARSEMVAAPVLLEQIGPVQIEGVIAEFDASDRNRRMRIAVRAVEGLAPEQTPRFVRFSYRDDPGFAPGRAVSCRAILSPPPRPVIPGDYAFHRDAWFDQLGGVGFSTGECRPLPSPPPATAMERANLWIAAVRRMVAEHVNAAAGDAGGGMAAAMVAGDRSFIKPADNEALRASGLAHLLAISGLHMAMAGGAVFFAVRMLWPLAEPLALRMPAVHVAAAVALIACTLYFLISGASVATQRAYIMALIAFGAKLFDKPAISLRSLAVAMAVVVLLQPEAVISPGFQMSFAATGALIALYEVWPRLDAAWAPGVFTRAASWTLGAAATSLVASLATTPFAMHHFDRAAVLSVFANILTTPVMSLWTAPSAVAAAIAAPFGLQDFFLGVMGQSIEAILWIGHTTASLSPEPDLPRLPGFGVLLAGVGLVIFCVMAGHGKWLSLAPIGAAIAIWATAPHAVGYVAGDGSVFLKNEAGWIELTDWRGRNGLNPLAIRGEIAKSPCPGKGADCILDLPAGRYAILTEPVLDDASGPENSKPVATSCPTSAMLVFTPPDGSADLRIDPCRLAKGGGAVIELTHPGRRLRTARQQTGRGWVQPLYDPSPKPPGR